MSITSVVNDNIGDSSFINAQKPIPPTISSYTVDGSDDTALLPAGGQTVLINGTGFQRGATVSLSGSAIGVVTWVSANQLSFTSPAKTAGTYTLYVVNSDGGTAIYIPGLIYSTNPTWVTSAGSLGSYYETQAISNTVVATDDTGSAMTYTLTSGSLPTGATLYANGLISGTAPVDSSSTTYSFTIDATDTTLQSTSRSFSLTINTDVVTWVNPTNGATISLIDGSYSNVLVATDAAGYNIASYTANTLPSGLTLTGNTISGTPTVSGTTTTLLTATAATTNRSATNTITWVITLNDPYWGYVSTLLSATINASPFTDDASTNNFNITINGDTRPNNFGPYTPGYYSNYFDGSGDYLALTCGTIGTGDFSIECWIYPTTLGSFDGFMSSAQDGGAIGISLSRDQAWIGSSSQAITYNWSANITANRWSHIAVTRQGTSVRWFVNGSLLSTGTNSSNIVSTTMAIGRRYPNFNDYYCTGYISNARLIVGTAVYTSAFTPPTSPLTAITNTSFLTCQSNRFIDTSTNNFTITANGNTTINGFDPFVPDSSYSTYGSGYFDGNGDYLTVGANTAFDFGTGDFTIEAWVNPISNGLNFPTFLGSVTGWSAGASGHRFNNVGYANKFWFGLNGSGGIASGDPFMASTNTFSFNTWHHYAVTRSGNTFRMFVNGVLENTQTFAGSYNAGLGGLRSGWSTWDAGQGYFTGYVSNLRLIKGTALYTSNFTPPTAPLTAISGTSLLTLQTNQPTNNNMFVDNSTNNFLITRNGNTTQGSFSPYPGTWSNYFDGTGDSLTLPASQTPLQPGSGDFTIEFWYNTTLTPNTYYTLFSYGLAGNVLRLFLFTTNAFRVFTGATLIITSADNVHQVNKWQHVAIVRSGTTVTLYVNGTSVGTNTSNSTNYVGDLTICNEGANSPYPGFISNFRLVKGTAVYTSAFTPPTQPLTPITNTQLLTCADNRFIDDSNNNFTITRNGDVNIQKFSPFNLQTQIVPTSYSVYFDGTGDNLSCSANAAFSFGTGDFTVEAWIYINQANGAFDRGIWSNGPTSAGSFGFGTPSGTAGKLSMAFYTGESLTGSTTLNGYQWYHVAVTRSGTTVRLFVNGTVDGTVTSSFNNTSNACAVGRNWSNFTTADMLGNISNLRVIKGTALYTTNFTPSTTPLTAVANTSLLTCQSTTIIDNSTNNFTITVNGNSQPLPQNPFGYTNPAAAAYTAATLGGSMYFDGTGDYVNTVANSAFTFGTGDLTLECWIYQTATSAATYRVIFGDNVYGSTGGYTLYSYNNALTLWKGGSGGVEVIAPAGTITLNAWTHVAWTRSGSSNRLFINGTQVGATTTDATNYTSTISYIGASQSGTLAFIGYMSNVRIVKGQSLYTSNFVPPQSPLTAVQNSVLLLNGTSGGIIDSSMITTYETVADAKLSTSVTKYGNNSMYFDGTGDWLTSPYNAATQEPGSKNLTWEMWIKTTSSLQYATLYSRQPGAFTSGMYALLINSASATAGDVALWVADYNAGAPLLLTTGANIRDDNWHHIAVVRNSSAWVLYVDGTSRATGTWSGAIAALSTAPRIAADQNYTRAYAGYIADLRLTFGIARYTTNFTPTSAPFPRY